MGAAVVTRSPFDDHCRPLSMQSSQSKSAAAMVKPFTVWVVDDDPDLRHMVSSYLLDQGYEACALGDGRQLIARLEFQRPDLLVLDLMMPGDDGLV